MLRQLHFSFVDIELHHRYQPGGHESVTDVRNRIAKTTTILPTLPEDAFLCSFGHIFAGGYAAGYYSYKWGATRWLEINRKSFGAEVRGISRKETQAAIAA